MKITIEGEARTLNPADLDATELGAFITNLASLAHKIGGKDSRIAITAIEPNCISLSVLGKNEAAVKALSTFVAAQLAAGSLMLPTACNDEIRYLNGFSKRLDAALSFVCDDQTRRLRVTPKALLRQAEKRSPMRYETTIYGEVVDVGGVTPNVHLDCVGHGKVKASLSRELAIQLAPRLYQVVGLRGMATEVDGEITDFSVTEVTPYRYQPGTDPCAGLRELEAQYGLFSGVDPAEFARDQRG
jgi:hypothetical protein